MPAKDWTLWLGGLRYTGPAERIGKTLWKRARMSKATTLGEYIEEALFWTESLTGIPSPAGIDDSLALFRYWVKLGIAKLDHGPSSKE